MQDSRGFDTGQAHVEALIRNGEALVVDPEEMQHRRVQVADVNRILGCVIPQFIRIAVRCSGIDAAACHPHGEALDVMIAADSTLIMNHRCATKFAAPDDQCFVQQAALLQIIQQSRNGLIRQLATDIQGDNALPDFSRFQRQLRWTLKWLVSETACRRLKVAEWVTHVVDTLRNVRPAAGQGNNQLPVPLVRAVKQIAGQGDRGVGRVAGRLDAKQDLRYHVNTAILDVRQLASFNRSHQARQALPGVCQHIWAGD